MTIKVYLKDKRMIILSGTNPSCNERWFEQLEYDDGSGDKLADIVPWDEPLHITGFIVNNILNCTFNHVMTLDAFIKTIINFCNSHRRCHIYEDIYDVLFEHFKSDEFNPYINMNHFRNIIM